jgi:hypothetical protein
MNDISCNTCGTHFTAYDWVPNQAPGCASTVYYLECAYYIRCDYGSEYDMAIYLLSNKYDYDKGTICDRCITKLILDNKAEIIYTGAW